MRREFRDHHLIEKHEVASFYVEACGCGSGWVRIVAGETQMLMTREAFMAFSASLAHIGGKLMEHEECLPQPGAMLH